MMDGTKPTKVGQQHPTDQCAMEQPKLLGLVRRKCRLRHYTFRTEGPMSGGSTSHPRDLGDDAIELILSDLATQMSLNSKL